MIGGSFVSKEYIQLMHNSSDPADTQQTQQLSLDPVTWTEQTRYVKGGAAFRFKNRKHLHQIYRDTSQRIYIKKGRQTEMSEWLVNLILFNGWRYPGTVHVYIADRQSHTYKFSNQRMKIEAIKQSNLIQKIVQLKDHTTTKMIFKNGSICYFISAWNEFIEAESIAADFIYDDEIQNQQLRNLATLLESMSHSQHKRFYAVGIGTVEGSEWDLLFNTTKFFRWDQKSESWIAKNPTAKYSGYWIPQTIVPSVTAKEIEEKRHEYSPVEFAINVMGESVRGEEKPLTITDMNKIMLPNLSFTMPSKVNQSLGPVIIGIDWGGGKKAFTVPYITQYTDINIPICRLLYTTRITDPGVDEQVRKISNLIDNYNPVIGIQDIGGGIGQMQDIDAAYGGTIARCHFSAPLETPYVYNKLSSNNLIKTNHTRSIEAVFDMIKRPHMVNGKPIYRTQIPYHNPQDTEWLLDDFTSMYGSMATSAAGNQYIKYSKSPDAKKNNDALMAAVYNQIAFTLWKRNNLDNESFTTYN